MDKFEQNRLLEEPTLVFAVAVVGFVTTLPKAETGAVIGRQLVKSGTSIGSNYREANRAKFCDEYIHKTAVVLKEASETEYWLELCTRTAIGDRSQLTWLSQEAREQLAIFTTINRKAKGR